MIRRHGRSLRLLLMIGDALVAMTVLIGISAIRVGTGDSWPGIWSVVPSPVLLLTLYSLLWVGLLASQSLYQSRSNWTLEREVLRVIRAAILFALITFASLFLLQADAVSRPVLLAVIPIQVVVTLLSRAVIRSVVRALRLRGRNLRHVLVVGTGATAIDFATRLEERWDLGFVVIGLVGDQPVSETTRWPVLGSTDELPSVLHDVVADEVAVCLEPSDRSRLEAIVGLCVAQGKTVRLPLEIPTIALTSGHVEELDGTPVVSLISGPDRELGLAVKRIVDVVGAIAGLIVLSPVFLIAAILIKRGDGGPAIFRQWRAGLNGRPFQIVKFRTMTIDADAQRAALREQNEIEGNASFKITNDPRITRVGHFLRKTSIDELPQLWNVLRGEMSLVGPRPHPFDDVAGYDDWHRRRLSMKPGITGLWQIHGRTETSFDRWVQRDLDYIDRWSLWLDFRVIAETIPALLRSEGR
jgi:exopolysaccharide biosynthesis polyprenyl glycosylphosphotransferase